MHTSDVSTHGGARAIAAALLANLGIALAKLIAFAVTASSSLLAESVHSLADSGNQLLLLLGGRRARRPPDDAHPFGYGRERYLYAFVVAIVLFAVGGLFAVYEGVEKLRHPHELDNPAVAVAVLLVAIGLESASLRTAVRESAPSKGNRSWATFIRQSRAPELPVVLLEDTAALVGLVLALVAVALSLATGNGRWDGVGTLAIGLLLIAVAVVLAVETKGMLIGESATAAQVVAIRAAIAETPGVTSVIHLRTLHLGPEELLVAAKIGIDPSRGLPEIARTIDDAEARLRAAVPLPAVVYLEPDLLRPASTVRTS